MEKMNPTAHSDEELAPQASSPPGLGLSPATWAAAGAVAKWVGEKVAGGIVGAAAGKVFSEVMDAIGLGGPDLVGKLDRISDQLVQVQRSLDRLIEMTEEILKQLAELKDFMVKSLKIEALVAAMTRIEVAYGSASDRAPLGASPGAISLRLLVEKMPRFKDVTQKDLQDAALSFAKYVSDIPDQIATIQRVLTDTAFGQDSLLTYWAKELAQQVKANRIGREAAYLVLEGYFLRAVSVQLKGVSVHCVALGTDRLGPDFIREFLQDDFAKTMKSETAAFVEAVELLLFLTLAPTMPTGLQDGLGEREFPKHVDEILLRADLLCAALNLTGHKPDATGKSSPSIQAAIQGIYGRALLRPSDLTNGNPPAIAPAGYRAAAGADMRTLPFPCLDLIESEGRAVLRDATSSFVRVAHYFWAFPSPEPAVGKPIDPTLRGGVTPARYPIFGPDEPPVLAAGVFDVSRLYRGLPSGARKTYTFTKFPGGNFDLGYYDERCTDYHHALTNDKGYAFETFFNVVHIYRLSTRQHSYVVHPLFSYSGGPAKVRLTAHVASAIHRNPRLDGQHGTALGQWWEVYNHLKLRRVNGWEREFYNSVDAYGDRHPISVNTWDAPWSEHYDRRYDGLFSIDFDLEAGVYELLLDSEVAFTEAPLRYEGWQSTSLGFFLHGLSLERR